MPDHHHPHPELRLPWSRSDRLVPRRIVRPLQEFLATSTAGGLILAIAVVVALVWANSPWESSYRSLLETRFVFGVASVRVSGDVRFLITEGLMAVFFLVVGLEIKRELTTGELRHRRAVLLPVIAAASGMVVPALLYLAVAGGQGTGPGWAIPMATDIAFALGVLAFAGSSVPSGLRSLLLALAIVDDIGSVVVVALVSSAAISGWWLVGSLGVAAAIFLFPRIHVRSTVVYVALGLALWFAMFRAGIHPALAGVVMGLLTPSEPFQRPRAVSEEAHRTADATEDDPSPPDADAHHWLRLAELSREAVSPLTRVEHILLPWSSFLVLPMFAFANTGVALSGSALAAAAASTVAWAILIARIAGKTIGIWGGTTAATRLRIASRPPGVERRHLFGMAAAAGTGFTVSLFVAQLVFAEDRAVLDHATIALLLASVLSGAFALVVLRRPFRAPTR
jgi:Na+:H+ antiporter, NhaA family